jgi:hypothetical protein
MCISYLEEKNEVDIIISFPDSKSNMFTIKKIPLIQNPVIEVSFLYPIFSQQSLLVCHKSLQVVFYDPIHEKHLNI